MMKSLITALVLGCFISAFDAKSTTNLNDQLSELNFVGIRTNKGKHEVRVAQNGLLGMEISIPGKGEQDLFVRFVTDGENVVKLIYSNQNIIETCEIEKNDNSEVDLFLRKFVDRNETLSYHHLMQENIQKHFRQAGKFQFHPVHRHSELAPEYRHIIDLRHLKKQCRKSHAEKKNLLKAYHQRQSTPRKRSKRADDTLIYPGTKWCGRGSTALNYDDLGEARSEDRCCRTHDYCEYYVEGMTTKWGYFNPRLTTISHCDCDDTFMGCLKNLGSTVADMIGDIYFNIAKTQCFVFKRVKKCAKRKWWGKCERWTNEFELTIKDAWKYENH